MNTVSEFSEKRTEQQVLFNRYYSIETDRDNSIIMAFMHSQRNDGNYYYNFLHDRFGRAGKQLDKISLGKQQQQHSTGKSGFLKEIELFGRRERSEKQYSSSRWWCLEHAKARRTILF